MRKHWQPLGDPPTAPAGQRKAVTINRIIHHLTENSAGSSEPVIPYAPNGTTGARRSGFSGVFWDAG